MTRQLLVLKPVKYFMFSLLVLSVGGISFATIFPSEPKARVTATRVQIKVLVLSLEEYAKSTNQPLAGGNADVISKLTMASDNKLYPIHGQTNSRGELLDYWQVPFQIKIIESTNFISCSAGKDKVFGDEDDIIYNSVSNNFVKP